VALTQLKQMIRRLRPEQRRRLGEWLREQIHGDEEQSPPSPPQREVVEEREGKNLTYRLEKVRCGKKGCKCAGGELHGPYWYAYWSEAGKTKSRYVGKKPTGMKKRRKAEVS
jgi:hypothetical protein